MGGSGNPGQSIKKIKLNKYVGQNLGKLSARQFHRVNQEWFQKFILGYPKYIYNIMPFNKYLQGTGRGGDVNFFENNTGTERTVLGFSIQASLEPTYRLNRYIK